MDFGKAYSRRSFLYIFLILAILLFLVDASFYYGMNILFSKITITMQAGSQNVEMPGMIQKITAMNHGLRLYFIPVSTGVFLVLGLVLWGLLRSFVKKNLVAVRPAEQPKAPAMDPDQAALEKQKQENHDQKLFVHMLSVFQREGRLVDFFSENLDLYEDAQIGAAVRNIHESCKKSIDKYIKLKSIIDQEEGGRVMVEAGFDPGAIKLIGNVAGEPPFTGTVRHRGWRIAGLDLPKLSDTGQTRILSPAEVEI